MSDAWPGVRARADGRTLRIGHKGAAGLVEGNTLASLRRAVALGCDAVEFDVLPASLLGGDAAEVAPLRLAHDPADLRARPDAPTLEQALDLLCEPGMAHVGLDVDVKWPGEEAHLVAALRARGLVGRTLASTMEPATMRELRRLAPELRLGWSVPRLRRDPLASPVLKGPALVGLLVARELLPGLLTRAIERGHVEAAMVHWAFVTPRLVRRVTAVGELHVWTVDEAPRAARLVELGVTGIISNDPAVMPRQGP